MEISKYYKYSHQGFYSSLETLLTMLSYLTPLFGWNSRNSKKQNPLVDFINKNFQK